MAGSPTVLLPPTAALAAGSLALHELRYRLAPPRHAGELATVGGHAYLPAAQAVAVLLLPLAAAAVLLALARGDACATPRARLGRAWRRASAALLVVHLAQEWVEGLLATGRPPAHEAFVGDGWLVLALGRAERAPPLAA